MSEEKNQVPDEFKGITDEQLELIGRMFYFMVALFRYTNKVNKKAEEENRKCTLEIEVKNKA